MASQFLPNYSRPSQLGVFKNLWGLSSHNFYGENDQLLRNAKKHRKSRKNVRNLMIFKHNSCQAELKLYAKFCGYRTENYRDLEGRLKGALIAARLSNIESLCDSYNLETLPWWISLRRRRQVMRTRDICPTISAKLRGKVAIVDNDDLFPILAVPDLNSHEPPQFLISPV
jgi:hypothetical protein